MPRKIPSQAHKPLNGDSRPNELAFALEPASDGEETVKNVVEQFSHVLRNGHRRKIRLPGGDMGSTSTTDGSS